MYFVICDTADGEGMLIWGEGGVCKCARVEYCNFVMRTVYSCMIIDKPALLCVRKNVSEKYCFYKVVIYMRNLAQTKTSFRNFDLYSTVGSK